MLYEIIKSYKEKWEYFYSIAERSAWEIDTLGIREANRQAMEDVIHSLLSLLPKQARYTIKIDGRDNYIFRNIHPHDVEYIIKGDLKEKVISAASILAKVTRDQKMCEFSLKYPDHGFNLHKGYGTRKHQEALLYHGITPVHRKSYAPIKRLISMNS
jgi:ribonuclease HII